MKKTTKIKLNDPYHQYLDFLKTKNESFEHKDPQYYLERYKLFKEVVDAVPCGIYILNFQAREYLFVSEYARLITGFSPEYWVDNSLDFQLSRIHPEDFEVYSNEIFKKFREYSYALSYDDIKDIKFSLNYRYRRRDESYIKVLQQYVILERDSENNPILILGIITDITAYKTDNKMVFAVTKYNKEAGYEIVMFSDSFIPENLLLTKREIEIIKLIRKGLSSKEMAAKLFISVYTVRAHRRNILEKTNCKNSPELSDFVLTKGII